MGAETGNSVVWFGDTDRARIVRQLLRSLHRAQLTCRIGRAPPQARIMTVTIAGDFGRLIGARMSAEHESLAARWLDRLNELLPVTATKSFPRRRCWTTSRR